MPRTLRTVLLLLAATVAVSITVLGSVPRAALAQSPVVTSADEPLQQTTDELDPAKAVLLGVIEGVTEFLPVSSTGHLLVANRLLGIGATEATKEAADAYSIVIQGGAILAVAVLYWRRIWQLVRGLFGKDEEGRQILFDLVVAFLPAAVIGLALEKKIKDVLFAPGYIAAAWIAGGLVILWLVHSGRMRPDRPGLALGDITVRHALVIGAAQCLAMWPGTSRSLITIVAASLLGFSLAAAVEFSFLLGLVTLSAATVVDLAKHGGDISATYGFTDPAIGFVAAFVAALVAVKWMVGYLQRHSFAVFGWYRLAVAGLTIVLLLAGTISGVNAN